MVMMVALLSPVEGVLLVPIEEVETEERRIREAESGVSWGDGVGTVGETSGDGAMESGSKNIIVRDAYLGIVVGGDPFFLVRTRDTVIVVLWMYGRIKLY